MATTQRQLEAKQRHADKVLRAAYARSGEMEPRMNGRSFAQFVPEALRAAGAGVDRDFDLVMKHWGMFLEFIFANGPAPDRTTKRLYAIVWAVRRKLLLGMNIREVSEVLGEVRASGSARINTDFSDYLALWGFKGTRVNGQKRETSREMYAELAKGNTSRKCGAKQGDARKAAPRKKSVSAEARRAVVRAARDESERA